MFKFKLIEFDQRCFRSHNVRNYPHNRQFAATVVVEHKEKQHLEKIKTYAGDNAETTIICVG